MSVNHHHHHHTTTSRDSISVFPSAFASASVMAPLPTSLDFVHDQWNQSKQPRRNAKKNASRSRSTNNSSRHTHCSKHGKKEKKKKRGGHWFSYIFTRSLALHQARTTMRLTGDLQPPCNRHWHHLAACGLYPSASRLQPPCSRHWHHLAACGLRPPAVQTRLQHQCTPCP